MILREAAANKAHIAPHGQKTEAFCAVVDTLTCNTDFGPVVDAKRMRDCY